MSVRILVTGSRNWTLRRPVEDAIQGWLRTPPVTLDPEVTLVHGDCRGLDRIASHLAEGWGWTVEPHDAAWEGPCDPSWPACRPGHRVRRSGGSTACPEAGKRRNQAMVDLMPRADVCIGFLLGASWGTRDCLRRAVAAGIPVVTVHGSPDMPRPLVQR